MVEDVAGYPPVAWYPGAAVGVKLLMSGAWYPLLAAAGKLLVVSAVWLVAV